MVDSCSTDPKKGFHFFCGCMVIGVHCWNMCRKNKPLVPILSCFDKFWMERNSVHFYFISDHFGFWKNLMIHLAILDQLLFAGKMNFFFHLSWWSKCVPYSQSFSHLKFCQSDSYLIIFFPLPVCTFTRLFTMVLDFIWLRKSF